MIPNQLFPAFYLVTMDGDFARSLFDPNLNIESVKVVSKRMENDFVAQARADEIIRDLKSELGAYDDAVKYNDLFTPKSPEMVWAVLNRRKDVEPFDELGDMVLYKSTLTLDHGTVSIKVLADPDAADELVMTYSKMKAVPQLPTSQRIH